MRENLWNYNSINMFRILKIRVQIYLVLSHNKGFKQKKNTRIQTRPILMAN